MKLFSYLLLAGFMIRQVAAQSDSSSVVKPLVIEDIVKSMSKGDQPGFKISIDHAKKKGTVDALAKAVKPENKTKVELVNNEYILRGAIIKGISARPLNIYSVVNEYEDHVDIFFFYEEDSVFLSKEKNETEYLSARKYTRDFAVQAYRGAVQERIDLENKKLKDLQSQLDNLHQEQDKLSKSIAQENQNIDNSKEKIATSEQDQERMRKQVQDQKALVDQARSSNNETLQKDEEKKLKGFESDLSKSEKQEDDYHQAITKSESNIREYQRNVSNNEASIKSMTDEVNKQQEVVNQLRKRLESIQ